MAEITITKKTLNSVKQQTGVYSKLRFKEAEKLIYPRITDMIENHIKVAFYEWAGKHKGGEAITDREWKRFQKILQRYL